MTARLSYCRALFTGKGITSRSFEARLVEIRGNFRSMHGVSKENEDKWWGSSGMIFRSLDARCSRLPAQLPSGVILIFAVGLWPVQYHYSRSARFMPLPSTLLCILLTIIWRSPPGTSNADPPCPRSAAVTTSLIWPSWAARDFPFPFYTSCLLHSPDWVINFSLRLLPLCTHPHRVSNQLPCHQQHHSRLGMVRINDLFPFVMCVWYEYVP